MSPEATAEPPHRGQVSPRVRTIRDAIAHASHLLPDQGPIGTFIHHNTLHAFQHQPFDEAIEAAGRIHDARVRLPEATYRAHWRAGRITDDDVAEALLREAPTGLLGSTDLLAPQEIRTLMLRHGLGEETDASVGWRLAEDHGESRVLDGVRASSRAALLDETAAWLASADRDARERMLDETALDAASLRALARGGAERAAVGLLWALCEVRAAGFARASTSAPPVSLRELVLARGARDPAEHADGVMIRFLGAYLDEGMARWPMPERDRGLIPCMVSYQETTRRWLRPSAVRPRWLDDIARRLARVEAVGALEATCEMLDELGVAPEDRETFIARTLLQLPGWHGMVARLERHPEDRSAGAPPVSMDDLTALRLCLDLASARESLLGVGDDTSLRALWAARPREVAPASARVASWRLFALCQHTGISAPALLALPAEASSAWLEVMERFDAAARRRVLHDAYELHHQHEVLGALADLRARPVATPPAPRFQVAFCIDDREEGIRRHFEELDEAHETFGVAGFFGVAMRYEALDDRRPAPLCPAVVTPSHTIVERARAQHGSPAALRKSRQRQLGLLRREVADASRSLAAGAVFTSLVGALAVIPLTLRLVAPRLAWRMQTALLRRWLPAPETELALARDEGDVAAAGFTLAERVERVAATLQNMGMLTRFGGLVALLGHGASTVNNPHHSAYDCGACGGRNGGPNARAFAAMANDPAVREGLRDKGIVIPEGTWFLGGVHDTTTDAVTLADEDSVPATLRDELAALRRSLDEARARSAHERCRRFAHAPARLTPAEALRHVEARAVDLAQPRPELGHVTNAITVVGRRALTRGLFLDRRALLVSYDPASDGEGRVLARILGAVVPVCAGINLEYLFSTVDNDRWGSGTKLPHNLAALLGVMEGTRGDLRTGLPRQMIEIHEPVRLLLVVEATPARLRATLAGDPTVAELVERGWVRLVSVDPVDGAAQVYTDGVFAPWEHATPRLPTVRSAMDHYSGRSENLPPVRISPSPEVRS